MIGVIAIVLGALGALDGIFGVASPWVMELAESVIPAMKAMVTDAVRGQLLWTVLVSLLELGLACMLLVAGVGLRRRRRWSVAACRGWAVLKMLLVVGSSVLGYQVARAQMEAMSQQTVGMPPMTGSFADIVAGLSLAMNLAWGWAFPVFVLIWLARGRIKDEIVSWA